MLLKFSICEKNVAVDNNTRSGSGDVVVVVFETSLFD